VFVNDSGADTLLKVGAAREARGESVLHIEALREVEFLRANDGFEGYYER